MALFDIVTYPDKRLRSKAETVKEVNDGVRRLIDDMAETMYSESGLGLAANQVGLLKRIAVIDVDYPQGNSNLIVLVNPEIGDRSGTMSSEEGCLSFPGIHQNIERSFQTRVRALDREGRPFELDTEGLLSTALQHEIDHLNGVLIIDRVSFLNKRLIHNQMVKLAKIQTDPVVFPD